MDSGSHKVCSSRLCRSTPKKTPRFGTYVTGLNPSVFGSFLRIMNAPSTFTDFRQGTVVHIGGDQLNLNINFPRMLPAPHPIGTLFTIFFYPWKALRGVYSYFLFKVFHCCDSLVGLSKHSVVFSLTIQQDLSHRVVLQGTHYIAIGEHADLWVGRMSDKQVAVKVLRGCSSSAPNFLPKSKEVSN